MVWFEFWCHTIKWCDQLFCHKNHATIKYEWNLMSCKVYVSFICGSSHVVDVSFWLIVVAPSDGESISFSTKNTILVIALLRVWLPLFESPTWSVTLRTSPFLSASTPIILVNGHWLCRQSCSFSITISPTSKFPLFSFRFSLLCKLCRNSFLHFVPKLICSMLHASPSSSKIQIWCSEDTRWGNDNIRLHC